MGQLSIPPPTPAQVAVYETVSYDQSTWDLEKDIASQYRAAHNGLLPTGSNELGGEFWDYVRWRESIAVNSGHLDRFEAEHPCTYPWLEEDACLRSCPVPPRLPCEPSSCPPCEPPTWPPINPCPPGTVPEPQSVWLCSIGLVLAVLARRICK
jgi:hypothetical protein